MLDLVGPLMTPLAGWLSPLGKKASWSRVPRLVGWPQLRRVRNVGEQGVCDREGLTTEAVLGTSLGERVGARSWVLEMSDCSDNTGRRSDDEISGHRE